MDYHCAIIEIYTNNDVLSIADGLSNAASNDA